MYKVSLSLRSALTHSHVPLGMVGASEDSAGKWLVREPASEPAC